MHTQNLFSWRLGNGSGSEWISIYRSFWIRIRMDLYLPTFLDKDPRFCEIWNRFQIQVLKMHSTLEISQQKHSLNVFLLMFGFSIRRSLNGSKLVLKKDKNQRDVFCKMRNSEPWNPNPDLGSGLKKRQMLDPDPYIRNIVSKRHAGMHNDQNS